MANVVPIPRTVHPVPVATSQTPLVPEAGVQALRFVVNDTGVHNVPQSILALTFTLLFFSAIGDATKGDIKIEK